VKGLTAHLATVKVLWILFMRIVKLFVISFILTLQGCADVVYIGKALFVAATGINHVKPDRIMEFNIQIEVNGADTLRFTGETMCDYESGLHGGTYRTVSKMATTTKDERTWVLSGIDCWRIERPDVKASYAVYEITGPETAKVHYVHDRGAKLVLSNFRWSEHRQWRNQLKNQNPSSLYFVGPFVYQKFQFKSNPILLIDLVSPTLVTSSSSCINYLGTHAEMKLTNQQLANLMSEAESKSETIRRGYLSYDATLKAWYAAADTNLSHPQDVIIKRTALEQSLAGSCILMKFSSGGAIANSGHGSRDLVYLPNEKALIRVANLTNSGIQSFLNGEKSSDWWLQ